MTWKESNKKDMKKITNIIFALAAAVCLAGSCQKEAPAPSLDSSLVGQWHLVSIMADDTELDNSLMDIYLVLNSNQTFELYQMTGNQESRYDLYTGTCTSEEGILSGIYANGSSWGTEYEYEVTGGSTLTLTSSDGQETQVYEKSSLPEGMKVNHDTRSVGNGAPIL